MKEIIAIAVATFLNGLAAWIVFGPFHTTNPLGLLLVFLLFAAPNVGTFWMLYTAIRYEKNPLPYILLALIPYLSIWYYVARAKTDKYKTRPTLEATNDLNS